MEPFPSSRTPVRSQSGARAGQERDKTNPASAAGLRRSAGIFNLKIHPNACGDGDENTLDDQLGDEPIPPLPPMHAAMFTPDSSANNTGVNEPVSTRKLNAMRRRDALSLKRPHPFSSAKPAAKSGFLARSSMDRAQFSSPQSALSHRPATSYSKRLHLTKDDSNSYDLSIGHAAADGALTPEHSYRGAKPVQTAFAPAGLQSKRVLSTQSPKPRVPETPCKRSALASDASALHAGDASTRQLPSFLIGCDDSHPHSHSLIAHDLTAHNSIAHNATAHNSTEHNSIAYNSTAYDSTSPIRTANMTTLPGGQDSPLLAHSKNLFPGSPLLEGNPAAGAAAAPVDRMQRFSLRHLVDSSQATTAVSPATVSIGTASIGAARAPGGPLASESTYLDCLTSSSESLEPPETPTKVADFHTSTPLTTLEFRDNNRTVTAVASRQASEAVTATPGTAVRRPAAILRSASSQHPSLNMLRSVDPADSLSLSPPDSIDLDAYSMSNSSPSGGSLSSPQTPELRGSRRRTILASSQTSSLGSSLGSSSSGGPLILSSSAESQSSPQPRRQRRMRIFGLNNVGLANTSQDDVIDKRKAPPPPIRVDTPLGGEHNEPRTPGQVQTTLVFDQLLTTKFDQVHSAALGEFSAVFVVTQGKARFAVKRTKKPMLGRTERTRRQEEVNILRRLQRPSSLSTVTGSQEDDVTEHVVHLFDEWVSGGYGYIMTEFCENGDLNQFLAAQGRVSRLEEWRVWKILSELTLGLAYVHEQDILHLDLKPANVFVTFEGHLKIGDFGMATTYPVPRGFEREGDREYIAPEVLEKQQYGKPADVFSMGLMMVEIAANIVLPDNGVHWHRLRSGDLSDAGRLSSGDLTGGHGGHGVSRSEPPSWAPQFLVDESYSLDLIVSAMLNPLPEKRISAEALLATPELLLVNARGQAGAIVYEGEYGPAPEDPEISSVWQRA